MKLFVAPAPKNYFLVAEVHLVKNKMKREMPREIEPEGTNVVETLA